MVFAAHQVLADGARCDVTAIREDTAHKARQQQSDFNFLRLYTITTTNSKQDVLAGTAARESYKGRENDRSCAVPRLVPRGGLASRSPRDKCLRCGNASGDEWGGRRRRRGIHI